MIVSRGTQQDYNTVGNGTVSVVSLASSQMTFSLLFKIAHSFPGQSDHVLMEKSKADLPEKLLLRENILQFS